MKLFRVEDVGTGEIAFVNVDYIERVELGSGRLHDAGLTPVRILCRDGKAYNVAATLEDVVSGIEQT